MKDITNIQAIANHPFVEVIYPYQKPHLAGRGRGHLQFDYIHGINKISEALLGTTDEGINVSIGIEKIDPSHVDFHEKDASGVIPPFLVGFISRIFYMLYAGDFTMRKSRYSDSQILSLIHISEPTRPY